MLFQNYQESLLSKLCYDILLNNMIKNRKTIKGFTLIEVMVTIIIITTILVGAFEFFRHCQRFIVDPELRLIAINYALETMEDCCWTIANPPLVPLPAGTLRDLYAGARTYTITPDSTNNYDIIEVIVDWNY